MKYANVCIVNYIESSRFDFRFAVISRNYVVKYLQDTELCEIGKNLHTLIRLQFIKFKNSI